MDALDRAQDEVRFVQTRHEELAAFKACAVTQSAEQTISGLWATSHEDREK